ncbi:hypothetical protein F3Y22_tig00110710pilonHSYRG00029 [Hibiscus syriacus]|uniref:PGG domain-containing protein n=1 Tax=Hibiscus syriacus TaxID=106335 RepID=A0A6A2ZU45_HIBSY|nr:ankyrin repeat-containing protein BDA1-like [Hibiscus syriacus]KAE8695448.1 hypothetical protein F3Y22_tig00110710pilonHSYRG00029 [Hibiscus syriacus]
MEMNPKLKTAAETGNVDALHVLILEDPYILEGIDQTPFIQTPLHVAANEGHIDFAMEMLNLKPSFAKKLNREGFSPMHLALKNGKTKLVHLLLETDKDLVRVKGWKGVTPFLYAATTGNHKLLLKFLEACPECIEDVTIRGETALHLALKHGDVEAFKLLFGWFQRTRHAKSAFTFEDKMVNWKDNDGNTVLHIAAMKEQREEMKLMLDSYVLLDVKAKNSKGLTAQDIIQKDEKQLPGRNIKVDDDDMIYDDDVDSKIKGMKKKVNPVYRCRVVVARVKNRVSIDMINSMLVVTALVITAVYQSSLSPPGGVWQGNNDNNPANVSDISTTNHYFPEPNYNDTIVNFLLGQEQESKRPGTTILTPDGFALFWAVNVLTFGLTIALTVFILFSFNIFLLVVLPLYMLVISYFCSMMILSPSASWSYLNVGLIVALELLPLALFLAWTFPIRYLWKQTKDERKFRNRLREVLGMNKCDIGSTLLFLRRQR